MTATGLGILHGLPCITADVLSPLVTSVVLKGVLLPGFFSDQDRSAKLVGNAQAVLMAAGFSVTTERSESQYLAASVN